MAKTITALKVQKKNHQRLNVYLDGEFAFGLSRFVAAWLQVGQELTEAKITELLSDDELESAYQQSLKFIGYRIRTTYEVDQHLRKKGINPEEWKRARLWLTPIWYRKRDNMAMGRGRIGLILLPVTMAVLRAFWRIGYVINADIEEDFPVTILGD